MVGWNPWLETGDLERVVKHESSVSQEEGDRAFASIFPTSGYGQLQLFASGWYQEAKKLNDGIAENLTFATDSNVPKADVLNSPSDTRVLLFVFSRSARPLSKSRL